MNERLRNYLRSLGMAADATDAQAWEYFQERRGLERQIANLLNYAETDAAAHTTCDLGLRAIGIDPTTLKTIVATPVAGNDGASHAGDLERAQAEQVLSAERTRIATIRNLASMAGEAVTVEMVDTAIAEGHEVSRASEAFATAVRSRRAQPSHPGSPAIHTVAGISQETLEGALLHRAGIDPTQALWRSRFGTPQRVTGEAAERLAQESWRYRELSMIDIVRHAAAMEGVAGAFTMGRSELLATLSHRAAFSTSALVNIFTTSMNSQLLAAYIGTPDSTTGGWIREADVADFKTNERARMEKGGRLRKHPRGSTADHGSYEDLVESYKLARYSQQFVVDEQDLIDDTFGGINAHAPSEMGEAARELRPDLVYSILLGNPAMRDGVTLFHSATHGNTATSTALTVANLSAKRAVMAIKQENGRNIAVQPRFLIVPEALRDTAIQLTVDGIIVDGTASALQVNTNPNQRAGLTVVNDSRIDNGVIDPTDPTDATVHAGSSVTWFLAGAASAHTIEVGYLRGTGRMPQMRSFVLSQGQWGIGWDIKMDIGAKALDWLGLAKYVG